MGTLRYPDSSANQPATREGFLTRYNSHYRRGANCYQRNQPDLSRSTYFRIGEKSDGAGGYPHNAFLKKTGLTIAFWAVSAGCGSGAKPARGRPIVLEGAPRQGV